MQKCLRVLAACVLLVSFGTVAHADGVRSEKFGFVLSPVLSNMKVTKQTERDAFVSVSLKDQNNQADSFMIAALADQPRQCGPEEKKVSVTTFEQWVELCQKASFWKGYTGTYPYEIHGETEPKTVKVGHVDMTVIHQKVTINNHLTLAVAFFWGSSQVDGKAVWYFLRFSNYERYKTLQASKELEAILNTIRLGSPA